MSIRISSNRAHILAFVAFAVWQVRLIREEYDNRQSRSQLINFYVEREKRIEKERLKRKNEDEAKPEMILI